MAKKLDPKKWEDFPEDCGPIINPDNPDYEVLGYDSAFVPIYPGGPRIQQFEVPGLLPRDLRNLENKSERDDDVDER